MLLLTATPIQNGLEDLHNLVTLLKPGLLSTSVNLKKKFVDPKKQNVLQTTMSLVNLLWIEQFQFVTPLVLREQNRERCSLELVWNPKIERVEAPRCRYYQLPTTAFLLVKADRIGCHYCEEREEKRFAHGQSAR